MRALLSEDPLLIIAISFTSSAETPIFLISLLKSADMSIKKSDGGLVPSLSRVDTQNFSSMLGRVVLSGLKNDFCFLKLTFLCLPKEK